LVSYVSEIVLATAFVLAFFYFSLVHRRSYDSPFDSRHTKTANQSAVWTALNASIGIFWDSALLFGAAITIAAVVAIKTGHSAYTGLFVSVAAQLSTVVLIVTWPFYFPACKHPQYRWLGLAIVCALCIAAVVLQVPATGHRPDIIYSDFETHCFNSYKNYQAYHDFVSGSMSPTSLMNLHWVTVVIAGGTGSLAIIQFVVFLLGLPVSSVSRFLRRWGWLSRFLDRFLALFWLVNFGCMWMHLASFVELRSEVASTAGPSLKEGEFSFGQILALATWLPTIIDFVVVWRGKHSAFFSIATLVSQFSLD